MERKQKSNRKYSPEFKVSVIIDMREHHLGYRETVRKYWNTNTAAEEDLFLKTLRKWERIYLEEGAAGFMVERRGRKTQVDPEKNRWRKLFKMI